MIANIIAGAAFIVSLAALVVSWRYGARSAKSAEDSAREAARIAKAELGRDHRELAPKLNGQFRTVRDEQAGRDRFIYFFTLPRTYRVSGDLVSEDNGRRSFDVVGEIGEAGLEHKVYLDDGRLPEVIELRFFPPRPEDPGETWSCPCGLPQVDEGDAHGHWVERIPVEKPSAPATTPVPHSQKPGRRGLFH